MNRITEVFVDRTEENPQWQDEMLFIEQVIRRVADSSYQCAGSYRQRKEYHGYIWHTHVFSDSEPCLAALVKDPRANVIKKHSLLVCRRSTEVDNPIRTMCVSNCRWKRCTTTVLEVTEDEASEMLTFGSREDLDTFFTKLGEVAKQEFKEAREYQELHKHCTPTEHVHVPPVVPLDEIELQLKHVPHKF